jgi:hypothetical protein
MEGAEEHRYLGFITAPDKALQLTAPEHASQVVFFIPASMLIARRS